MSNMAAADNKIFTSDAEWRTLIATGLVAGEITPTAIARFARTHPVRAEAAIDIARQSGLINHDGSVDEIIKLQLIADLPNETVARINASVARHLFTGGPERLLDAITHARAAGSLVEPDEMVAMADHGGKMSLILGDYRSAFELLRLAADLDTSKELSSQGHRLCDLALAADGLGNVNEGRQHLARAVSLGELAEDPHLVARGAVQYALPTDWYAGDPRAARLLQRATEMDLDTDDRVSVQSARALIEMRIPLTMDDGHQLAWITRPAVAQDLGDEALAASQGLSTEVRALALLAWRATHRAPAFLSKRRVVSTEALDLSQKLRHASHQVEAAVQLNVDALESGDRPLADQAMAVARWVAERDGNPRLKWRAFCLAAGAAHLDGDLSAAYGFRQMASLAGQSVQLPGWLGAEMLFIAQEVIAADKTDEMQNYLFDDSFPGLANPIGRSCVAYMFARTGDTLTAERHIRRAMRQLDAESSYLLLATRMTAVALLTKAPDILEDLVTVLTPWSDHIAVDSNAWWCDGPVSIWLAQIHHVLGHDKAAAELLHRAEIIARSMNDQRTIRRVENLHNQLQLTSQPSSNGVLNERETHVLKLLASGATNAEIARELSYSVSTIRDDTTSIYRKLQVKGRAEAVGRALQLNLISQSSS
jgi:DNA-binding CsgD family transcriptional regulator